MFSSQKRRSASFLGRREFNGSGSAVTGKKFKSANSPAADGTRRQFIKEGLRVLSPKLLSAGDTSRLHRCTAAASRTLLAFATLNDPTGSFNVARFPLMHLPRGRILPSAGPY